MPRRSPVDVDLAAHGRGLRDWRQFRGLSQRELAAAVSALLERSYGQDAVSEWENGQRRTTDPQRIALGAVLHVPPALLFPYPEVTADGEDHDD